ncbi:MAG: hypothetical protein OXG60_06060 [Chloroflexi bacterium]|nr:hypothetical protein [Chloroflexota bacterium]
MTAPKYELPVDNIASYLQTAGWTLVSDNKILYAFEGFQDEDGAPLELILPKNESAPDYSNYVRNSIGLHSVLTEKAPETIASEILLFDRDLLVIKVDSRSVDNAAMQMPPIKRLIGHSANMERSLKPYFNQYYLEARKMLKHFEIHQTCNGNVSYHVESQVGEIEPYQTLLFDDKEDPGQRMPLQRRVMERIATGLIDLQNATTNRNPQALISGYADGFNANMCNAILEISKHSPRPVQYSVDWSRKVPVSPGVTEFKSILIERPHIEFLKKACDKLKERKPDYQRIEGRVIGLSSSVDPQSDDVDNNERSIVVLRTDRNGSGRKLWINLGKEDYIAAHKAHIDWKTISVGGLAIKRRSGWQLADPHEFRILR